MSNEQQSKAYTRDDYDKDVKMVKYLLKSDPDNALIDALILRIDSYKERAPEFADTNSPTK